VTIVDIDLSRLDTLPIDELRALWAANMGRSMPPRQRRLLVRELAWRTQERAHAGFDAQTRRLREPGHVRGGHPKHDEGPRLGSRLGHVAIEQ
jgi:hypothetical protein